MVTRYNGLFLGHDFVWFRGGKCYIDSCGAPTVLTPDMSVEDVEAKINSKDCYVTATMLTLAPELHELLRLHCKHKFRATPRTAPPVPVRPATFIQLQYEVLKGIVTYGMKADLNHIDVTAIDHMYNLFAYSKFNGDVSKWDVSNVKVFRNMFSRSAFNGDVSKWEMKQATDISCMFHASEFNQDISEWRLCATKLDMAFMFLLCPISDHYKPKQLQK